MELINLEMTASHARKVVQNAKMNILVNTVIQVWLKKWVCVYNNALRDILKKTENALNVKMDVKNAQIGTLVTNVLIGWLLTKENV